MLLALACTALQAAPAAGAAAFYSSASGSVVTTTKLCDEGDTVLSMLKAIARTPRLDTRIYSRHESAQVTEPFWCEVHLKKNLRERGAWKKIGDKELPKALYLYAVDCLKKSGGRPTRHLDLNWIPGSDFAEGPPENYASVDLKKTQDVVIEDSGILPVVVDQH